ncbi:MAG: molybdopterin-dependent oxidoreductase, partial [Vicinamibacterales bacterium]|nr:molybdopterin-dependent oxidoreductase [Vicinamibacterales bacterium]
MVEASVQDGSARSVTFALNGAPFTALVDDHTSLMQVLREQAGLTSPKNGCAPQGSCGGCTVLVNGRAVPSCAVSATRVADANVVTLEGLEPHERHVFAHAFSATGGLQCGFCIPGIVIRASHLLRKTPRPTRREIAESLNNHICRCTGYVKIIDAIDLAARVFQGAPLPDLDFSGRIGTNLPRQDAEAFVLGNRPYIDDMTVPDMLFGAFLFSPHPRIRVRRIDTAAAAAMPGVAAVVTAADVPGERYQGLIEKDWPVFVAEGETTHCIGDILAAVAADSETRARAALAAMRIEFDELPGVYSPEDALGPAAPRVHPTRDNLLSRSVVRRGDVDAALAASAFVETRTFTTQRIEHAFLEPEACLAVPAPPQGHGTWDMGHGKGQGQGQGRGAWDMGHGKGQGQGQGQGRGAWDVGHGEAVTTAVAHAPCPMPHAPVLDVFSQGQGVFDDRRQIASLLGLPESAIRVTLVSNGGAFGGKEDLSIQGQVALLALRAGRPVKATLTREESIRLHPKRHPIAMTYTVGCDAEGHLTAVRARMIGDKGAYASVGAKVLERAAGHACGPYKVPAVDIEALAVYTNNLPCGAMRGFGANQAAFAIEGMLDILGERAGVELWDIRWRNALDAGDTFCTGQVLEGGVGLKQTLLAVKDVYRSARFAGIACGLKNVGIGNGLPEAGQVVAEVLAGDRIVLHTGFTEMGQGFYTTMAQCFCEAAGIDAHRVRTEVDTGFDTPCGMTTASRATVLGGQAALRAGALLRADLDRGLMLGDLAGRRYVGEFVARPTSRLDADDPHPRTHLTFGFATQVC